MRSAFFLALVVPLTLLLPAELLAQQDASPSAPAAPCSGPEHRQFDFWIGEWDVSADGKAAGTNSIRPVHGGCALNESWQGTGEGGISGGSYNIYDQASGRWHQTWVDAAGTLLQLDGGLVEGNMVLSGQRPAPDGKGVTLHRITWTPNEDGSVRQLWEASQDDGNRWSVLFDGLYVRRAELP